MRITSTSPTMRSFPTATTAKSRAGRARGAADRRTDRGALARPRGDRLQYRLDAGAAASARALYRPVRRHRAGDQAGLRASRTKRVSVLGTEATVKREYTRALIRDFAQGCEVTLVGSARARRAGGGRAARRAGRGRGDRRRDRAVFRRRQRPPAHRHGRARLHPLPAADGPAGRGSRLAGGLDRSGAGDRPPGGGPAGPAGGHADGRRRNDLHLGRRTLGRRCAVSGGRVPA